MGRPWEGQARCKAFLLQLAHLIPQPGEVGLVLSLFSDGDIGVSRSVQHGVLALTWVGTYDRLRLHRVSLGLLC